MDEIALIQEAQRGNLDSFNRLVLEYQQMAYNVAYRLLSDADIAADATQTAFISAYKNLAGYRGGSFKAWVMRIVTNACYDELRRMKRQPTVPLELTDSESDESYENLPWMVDSAPSPEERAEQAELEHAVQHCLNALSPDFKMVVVLIDVQGLNYDEVSQVLRSPLGTVKSRLARARLKMQDCLQQFWELIPAKFRQNTKD